jgi:uncharacterized SAM-binding protein YcdF (DUF218 family)
MKMYLLKQFIGVLATPLMIAIVIAVAAGICRAFGRRKVGSWLLVSSLAVIYLAAISPVSNALLARLEHRYAPLPEDMPLPAVEFVVVLGSGYTPHNGVPVTAALDEDGLVRISEGIRLVRRLKNAHLVVSGGAPPGQMPPALGYALLAHDLGVGESSLIVLDRALDTGAEAKSVFSLLGATPFLMVTSAYHMPRAMRLMEQNGAHPIPAPTGQRVNQSAPAGWRSLLPTADGLRKTDRALHEYLSFAAISAGIG